MLQCTLLVFPKMQEGLSVCDCTVATATAINSFKLKRQIKALYTGHIITPMWNENGEPLSLTCKKKEKVVVGVYWLKCINLKNIKGKFCKYDADTDTVQVSSAGHKHLAVLLSLTKPNSRSIDHVHALVRSSDGVPSIDTK